MGFFKKAFRKITKPISKVLDKVVPNEIKPLLPYAAAFAPYMLPTGMTFGASSGIFSNPIFSRALASGGINALSQLSQEGNEGDLNALSLGLASLQGGLGADGAAEKLRGMRSGKLGAQTIQESPMGPMVSSPSNYIDTSNVGILGKAKNLGLNTLAKGADFINESTNVLKNPGLNMETLKAASAPLSLGTGEVMKNEAIAAQKQYEQDLANYNAEQDQMMDIPGRSATFLQAYRAYGIDEDTIQERMEGMDLIYSAPGSANGGRIGYNIGGRVGYGMGGDIMEGIMGMFNKGDEEPDFNTMAETVETVEMKPKEYLFDNKLKFTVNPGEDEKMSVLNALFGDEEGIISEDRKQEYYNLYIPQLYRNGKMSKTDYEGYIEEGILTEPKYRAKGGMINSYNNGGSVLPNGVEMDYRGGGFIPMGSKERADDVPARVSKNEFVMTADAVRAAGGGSVNKGARKMYELMNNLEARV
jgi:hypothetical protein